MQSCLLTELKTPSIANPSAPQFFHTFNFNTNIQNRGTLQGHQTNIMEAERRAFEDVNNGSLDEEGRKAAHVKWDGKTIALGTFCAAEAAEKCEKAKSLTKKWRATMVPKPDVEWVKNQLEGLGIRVVNDRPGRRKKEQVIKEREERKQKKMKASEPAYLSANRNIADPGDSSIVTGGIGSYSQTFMPLLNDTSSNPFGTSSSLSGSTFPPNVSSTSRSFSNEHLNPSFPRRLSNERSPGMADFNPISASSLGLPNQGRRGSLTLGTGPPDIGPSPSRQHYQILKEHHDNLLKELQQTTYMMEMYQNFNFDDHPGDLDNHNPSMLGMASMMPGLNDLESRRASLPRRLSQGPALTNPTTMTGSPFPYDLGTTPRRDSLNLGDFLGVGDFQVPGRRDSAAAAYSALNTLGNPATSSSATRQSLSQNAPYHQAMGRMSQGAYNAANLSDPKRRTKSDF